MKQFKKPLLNELDYLESVWEGDFESCFATKHSRIQYLMEDMDCKDTIGYEFRYQLQNYAVELGIYKAHTKQEVDAIKIIGGKKRKAYCFKRKDKYYVFESWKPIEDIVKKEVEESSGTLSDLEEGKLKKRLDQIEKEQLFAFGLNGISGGFVMAEFQEVDDEKIYITLKSGVQSDCENRVTTEDLSLWRDTLEWTD